MVPMLSPRTENAAPRNAGADRSDQDEIVPMDQRMRVRLAQETLELGRVAPEHLRNLLGVEPRQATRQMSAVLGVHPYRVAGGEPAAHPSAPAANRLARPPRTARAAPSSTTIVPRGSAANPIHSRREEPRSCTGANTVPTGSPIIAGPAFAALVNTTGTPETAAILAARVW